MSRDVIHDLAVLHTAAIDARRGYEEARDDVDGGGGTRPLFQEMIAIHTKNADDLSHVLRRSGLPPNQEGSFMSSVNRTVMSLRSLFGGLGESVVHALIDAETRNLSHYDQILKSTAAPADVREVLLRNRERLDAAITRMRAVRA